MKRELTSFLFSLWAYSAIISPTASAASCSGILLRQEAPTFVSVGELLSYRIHLSNEGTCTLTSAVLTDYLPRRTIYREGQPAPAQIPTDTAESDQPLPVHSVRWNNVELAPKGGKALFEVKVEILPPANRTITDTACLEHPRLPRICKTIDIWVAER